MNKKELDNDLLIEEIKKSINVINENLENILNDLKELFPNSKN